MLNEIKRPCSFCKREVKLSWGKREHLCACGVRYVYRPPAIRKSEETRRRKS